MSIEFIIIYVAVYMSLWILDMDLLHPEMSHNIHPHPSFHHHHLTKKKHDKKKLLLMFLIA